MGAFVSWDFKGLKKDFKRLSVNIRVHLWTNGEAQNYALHILHYCSFAVFGDFSRFFRLSRW